MIKLTDTQAILLSSASQRIDGSLLPLPASITPGGGAAKAIAALIRSGLADERQTQAVGTIHREEGDVHYGVFISEAGLAAIDVGDAGHGGEDYGAAVLPSSAVGLTVASAAPATTPKPPRSTKQAALLVLLMREEGATSPELIAVTGWLPHTVRAALTGLRKKGHEVARVKRDGVTCYRVASAA